MVQKGSLLMNHSWQKPSNACLGTCGSAPPAFLTETTQADKPTSRNRIEELRTHFREHGRRQGGVTFRREVLDEVLEGLQHVPRVRAGGEEEGVVCNHGCAARKNMLLRHEVHHDARNERQPRAVCETCNRINRTQRNQPDTKKSKTNENQ